MTIQSSILVVEDDPQLATLVGEYLDRHGFKVSLERNGDRAVQRILDEVPDAVVLDIMLPGQDGLSVCKAVRSRFSGAILMLTARGDDHDEVLGLEVGADDYMAKPVRPKVLLARLSALLRRLPREGNSPSASGVITLGALCVDGASRAASFQGEAVDLTTAEFDLLLYLAEHAGTVIARDKLYTELRGIEWDGLDRSIDLRVCRVRKSLGDGGAMIKSVRGVGYQLAMR